MNNKESNNTICKISDSDTKCWVLVDRNILHRLDGPAVIYTNGDKEWFFMGMRHRIGGPAIEYIDGYKEWWIENEGFDSRQSYYRELYKRGLITYNEAVMEIL
jgi:hypothetical protein